MPGYLPKPSGNFQQRAAQHGGMAINSRSAMNPNKIEEVDPTIGDAIAGGMGGAMAGGAFATGVAGAEAGSAGGWWGAGLGFIAGFASTYL